MDKLRILIPNIKRVVKLSYKWMPFYTVALFISNSLIYLIPIVQAGVTGSIVNSIISSLENGGSGTRSILLLIGLYILVRLFSDFITSIQSFLDKRWFNRFSSHQEILEMEAHGRLEQGHLDDSKFKALLETVRHKNFWPLLNLSSAQFVSLGTVLVFITTTVLIFGISPILIPILILSGSFEFYVQLSYGKEVWNIWHKGGEDTKKFSHLKNHVTNKTASIQNQLFKSVSFITDKARDILSKFNREEAMLDNKKMLKLFFSHAIASLGFGVSLYIIIDGVIKGRTDVGTMVFYISILGQYVGNIDSFFKNISDQYKQALEVNDIFKLVDAKPFVKQKSRPTLLKLKSAPKIEFKDVHFNYPNSTDRPIFAGLNLTIEPGEKIALVGNNGAGKTTLIKLLCRFYDPDKGEILINGVNLKDMSKDEWYGYMSLLFQDYEAYLFKAKESIAMGQVDRDLDEEKIKRVALSSGAHEFISDWKDNYEQQLGSEFGGISTSQGQEQKIAIARALYRDSFILVLDEPTASVDALSEAVIFEEIRQSTSDRTLILISHRFNTVINMDRIIVIEHGKVVEEGGHADLIKNPDGVYAKMFNSQALAYKA